MKIEVCLDCNGKGSIEVERYRGEYDTEVCCRCNTTGRIIVSTTIITEDIPFGEDVKVLYELDKELHQLAREFRAKNAII